MTKYEFGFPRGHTDDTEMLLEWLGYLRRAMLRNVEGLTDEQVRWTPSGMLTPLIGILNHLTRLEWRWIDGGFDGAEVTYDEGEFRPGPELTLDVAVDAYLQRAIRTDLLVRSTPLTQVGDGAWAQGHDLRFVVLHVIEETARHAGHADITRELLDGTTGM